MFATESKRVIWITGLSGAGKTTLAKNLVAQLRKRGRTTILLDGDQLRKVIGADTPNNVNHSRESRLALAMQYAKLCRVIADQGITVIIATISMFSEIHSWNRRHLPGYFEVYLKVPLQELRRRDPKGIYKRFDSGKISYVAGLDLPVDEPELPDLLIEFDAYRSVAEISNNIIEHLNKSE